MLSFILASLVAFWGDGIDSKAGQVWWHHPYDGTFTYNSCDIQGDWELSETSLRIEKFSVSCTPPRGWIFEQSLKQLTFVRKNSSELWLGGRQVGEILSLQRGFKVEFIDQWDDRHYLRYFEKTEGGRRIEWFVRSSQYIDFDLRADE